MEQSKFGNSYAGEGRKTFALPDLRGRVPECTGQGDAFPNYHSAIKSWQESITNHNEDLHFHMLEPKADSTKKIKTSKEPLTVATSPPYISISFIIAVKDLYPLKPEE